MKKILIALAIVTTIAITVIGVNPVSAEGGQVTTTSYDPGNPGGS